MNPYGWILLVLAWGGVAALNAFCIYKMIKIDIKGEKH